MYGKWNDNPLSLSITNCQLTKSKWWGIGPNYYEYKRLSSSQLLSGKEQIVEMCVQGRAWGNSIKWKKGNCQECKHVKEETIFSGTDVKLYNIDSKLNCKCWNIIYPIICEACDSTNYVYIYVYAHAKPSFGHSERSFWIQLENTPAFEILSA